MTVEFWRRRQANIGQHQHLESQILSSEGSQDTTLEARVTALEDAPAPGGSGNVRWVGPFEVDYDDYQLPLGNESGMPIPVEFAAGDFLVAVAMIVTQSWDNSLSTITFRAGDPDTSSYNESSEMDFSTGNQTVGGGKKTNQAVFGGLADPQWIKVVDPAVFTLWLQPDIQPDSGHAQVYVGIATPVAP